MDLKHTTTKIPNPEISETPLHIKPIEPLSSFSNEKNHHHHRLPPPTVLAYKECRKNHAANIGAHALDGCGEFMPSPTYTPTNPTSLKCAACGCHRNFHRRKPQAENYGYVPSVLLSLGTAAVDQNHAVATPGTPVAVKIENPNGRKRFRTKFSQDQKEKMTLFAEKVGWMMRRCDDKMVAEFCNEIGVRRGVLKVWMHNNKNTFGKKENTAATATTSATVADTVGVSNKSTNIVSSESKINVDGGAHIQAHTNGSFSSS